MADQPAASTQTPSSPVTPHRSIKQILKEKRKAMGKARESDEDEPLEELGEGVTIIHKLWGRTVTLHPQNKAMKSGVRVHAREAEALRVAEQAGLPVPHVHNVETDADGKTRIIMDYIPGDTLSDVWPDLSPGEKQSIAHQLKDILTIMRSIPPPESYIGSCAVRDIQDIRAYDTYEAPACRSEQEFNDYLLSSLHARSTPPTVRRAFAKRLSSYTNHRIVFTHADLAPRNIIVRDGKIVGLIDWEVAGWYPEYWEYVKLFRGATQPGWMEYADEFMPQEYLDELVDYTALSRYYL